MTVSRKRPIRKFRQNCARPPICGSVDCSWHKRRQRTEEAIFEIVNQLNRGAGLIIAREERDRLAELNLIAGKRAKVSGSFVSALTYFIAGGALLTSHSMGASPDQRRHELTFALELNRAECEFLTGAFAEADQRLVQLSNRAETTVERAAVACLRTDVYTTLGQTDRAVAVCLDYLRYAGIDWTPHPREEETQREYAQIWKILGNRTIETLIDLPLMDDPASLATMDVLTKVLPPAAYTDANLGCMTICRAVSLSLARGNCDASCFAYVNFSRMTRPRFGDYEAGYRLGELGYELVERRGLKRFEEASTYLCFGQPGMHYRGRKNCFGPQPRFLRRLNITFTAPCYEGRCAMPWPLIRTDARPHPAWSRRSMSKHWLDTTGR
jgi:predicted ATPase